ncbi:CPBP family intramembrane metalloprotease [Sphingobacterium sp. lm-10]|uniref:CPBP family intramembrane glutamic endopeptidase n=1 Tax=Sphingobacterium sp. lm-10 TaxID=2944904 RepID=UPI002020967F|nr:CPBP family intramembrane glutamic endopeptidase [Sphingobacterium sp. lm-10]MCL7988590.1 CPBP family intramembrane metalloprotease [Sphingobacterium sp. lm-10]
MQQPKSPANSPGVSLLILVGFVLLCSFVLQLIILFGYTAIFENIGLLLRSGPDALSLGQGSTGLMYTMLATSSVSTFLLPPIILQYIERKSNIQYLPMSSVTPTLSYGLAVLFLVAFSPILGLFGEWNRHLQLPESWHVVESWMRTKEDEMALLTENLVMNSSLSGLALNLFVIAVLPAIAEEFFFRGALQNILGRWISNKHVVIWTTAIIFSAIHVQFFGFFPRMLLGAIFGYMLVLTNNIWIPILAHFVNNASVVLVAFYYTTKGYSYQQLMTDDPYHISLYFVSLIASVVVGWYFYRQSSKLKSELWNQAG